LEMGRRKLFDLESRTETGQGVLADDDLARKRDSTKPCARVRRVADDRVAHRFRAADIAGDERPGVKPHADGEGRMTALDALPIEATEHFHLVEGALDASDD